LDSPVSNAGRNEEKHTSFVIYRTTCFKDQWRWNSTPIRSWFYHGPESPEIASGGAKIAGPILEIQRFYGAKMPGPMDPLLDRKPDSHWINIW